ncbi:TetR/AcrR family transcriptional regulator [Rhodococcus erythropolis]|uniref:TetR/AcrR family transcriptional regulator n=1 Tax=Rhodococcus erythropolis TaxID=1833 RepID=UPI0021093167|nr:TetR/AcrR family transcriptional regulator [Rhodococcus erythropolis]MCQ4129100.1 TetR/AcrR family transcriptional regulator [Rhodococcus erythropolis]
MSKAAARIRTAAISVFAVKGYAAASTRDIAASLSLSPGAVYPHYKSKESLLFAISLEGHTSALAAVKQADPAGESPSVRLTSTVRAYVKWHAQNRDLARVVQYELRSLAPDHFEAIAALRRSTSRVFEQIITDGNTSNEFNTIDIGATTLAITSLGIDVSRWFPSQTYSDPDTLAHAYGELSQRMVGARRRPDSLPDPT